MSVAIQISNLHLFIGFSITFLLGGITVYLVFFQRKLEYDPTQYCMKSVNAIQPREVKKLHKNKLHENWQSIVFNFRLPDSWMRMGTDISPIVLQVDVPNQPGKTLQQLTFATQSPLVRGSFETVVPLGNLASLLLDKEEI